MSQIIKGFPGKMFGCNHTDPERLLKVPFIFDHLDAAAAMPNLADSCDYFSRWRKQFVSNGLLGNGDFGNCVEVWLANTLGTAQANSTGKLLTFTASQCLAWYKSVVPTFNQNDPSTDTGTDPLDLLKWAKAQGLIVGYGQVDYTNPVHRAAAIQLFGGMGLAVDIPTSWERTTNWDVTNQSVDPIAGGHMILASNHDPLVNHAIETWAEDPEPVMTADAVLEYTQAAYVMITNQWFLATGKTLQGFDLDGLQRALSLVV